MHRDRQLRAALSAHASAPEVAGYGAVADHTGEGGACWRCAGICCLGGRAVLLRDWATQAFFPKASWLALVIALAGMAYLLTAMALRLDEVNVVVNAVRRRLRRRAT